MTQRLLAEIIRRIVTIAAALAIALAVSGTAALAADGEGRPEPELQRVAVGTGGAVATTHPAATREALAAARASQQNTATTLAEPGFLDRYGGELSARFGQRFSSSGEIGVAQGISILPDGRFVAVADARGGGGDARVVAPAE